MTGFPLAISRSVPRDRRFEPPFLPKRIKIGMTNARADRATMSHIPDSVCGRNLVVNVIAASGRVETVGVMNERTNITDQPEDQYESTYAFLIRSEEKSRNVSEVAIYLLLILALLIASWQFAQQSVDIPAAGMKGAGCVVCVDEIKMLGGARPPKIKG
jgi:hypothetical protein